MPCEDVRGMTIEVVSAVVVAPCGAGVGVTGCVLDVLQRYAGGEGLGDEGVAEAVRSDRRSSRDAGPDGESLDHFKSRGVGESFAFGAVEKKPARQWVV